MNIQYNTHPIEFPKPPKLDVTGLVLMGSRAGLSFSGKPSGQRPISAKREKWSEERSIASYQHSFHFSLFLIDLTRGDVRVRATDDLVVVEPLLRDGAEVPEGLHGARRVEDVVDHALEVVRVVRVRHYRRVEHGLELEKKSNNRYY